TRGNVLGVPIRASLGYTDIEGVLLTSNLERFTGSLSLSPTFIHEHLTENSNAKRTYTENRFADTGQVSAAVAMDPTKPVKSDDPLFDTWGGYWQWLNSSGTGLLANTTRNPVASLLLRENTSIVRRFVGNAQFDYKFHFLPDLRANLNLGLEYTNSKGQDVSSPQLSTDGNLPGFSSYELFKQNRLLDFYFQYEKYFEDSFLTKFDLQAGYSYQNFKDDPRNVFFNNNTGMIENQSYIKNVSNLQSFFGRANINLFDKYLFTLTLRRDGSSRWLKE